MEGVSDGWMVATISWREARLEECIRPPAGRAMIWVLWAVTLCLLAPRRGVGERVVEQERAGVTTLGGPRHRQWRQAIDSCGLGGRGLGWWFPRQPPGRTLLECIERHESGSCRGLVSCIGPVTSWPRSLRSLPKTRSVLGPVSD